MMFLGNLLIKSTTSAPYPVTYTAPFRRAGPAALFTGEVIQMGTSPTLSLKFSVEHRSDTDDWAEAGGTSITTTGVFSLDVTGLKERVRIAASLPSGSVGDFAEIRLDGISWRL